MVLYFFFRDSFILRRERREDERLIQLGFPKASKKTGLRGNIDGLPFVHTLTWDQTCNPGRLP